MFQDCCLSDSSSQLDSSEKSPSSLSNRRSRRQKTPVTDKDAAIPLSQG